MTKYYSTMHIGFYIPKEILNKHGAINYHNQYRIACKAKSRAEADRIIQSILKTTSKIFTPNYTNTTGELKAIEAADKFIAVMQLDHSSNYISIQDMFDEVQEFKKNQIK